MVHLLLVDHCIPHYLAVVVELLLALVNVEDAPSTLDDLGHFYCPVVIRLSQIGDVSPLGHCIMRGHGFAEKHICLGSSVVLHHLGHQFSLPRAEMLFEVRRSEYLWRILDYFIS